MCQNVLSAKTEINLTYFVINAAKSSKSRDELPGNVVTISSLRSTWIIVYGETYQVKNNQCFQEGGEIMGIEKEKKEKDLKEQQVK